MPARSGSFRSFYHSLWLLVIGSGLCFSIPLWLSFKDRIAGLPLHDRYELIGKVALMPAVLLVLLWYGEKNGYLKWIISLGWPDRKSEDE